MDIILAVDIMEGKVVKAYAGMRLNYKPLVIEKTDFSNPIFLIKQILKRINLKKIYIADLDSIRKTGNNNILVEKILNKFPNLLFLIDAGFEYPLSVYNYHKRKNIKKLNNYRVVLGTETIKNYNLKSFKFINKCEISIDFNGNESEWLKKIKKERASMNIILMFLKKVGGRGVNMKLVKKLYKYLSNHKLTLAGGINSNNQITQLSRIGFENVLSSTLLHKRLSRDSF